MFQNKVSNPEGRSVQRDTKARVGGESLTLLSFDDLVVDHSLGPVVVRVVPTDSECGPFLAKDDLLTELQCEV